MNNINNVNPAPQMNGANGAKRAEIKQQSVLEMKKDGNKQILLGMAAAGAIAAAGIAIGVKTGKINFAKLPGKDFKAAKNLVSNKAERAAQKTVKKQAEVLKGKQEKWVKIAAESKSNAAKDYATRKAGSLSVEISNMPKTPKQTLNSKMINLREHIANITDSTAPEKVKGLLRQAEAATGKECGSTVEALENLAALIG